MVGAGYYYFQPFVPYNCLQATLGLVEAAREVFDPEQRTQYISINRCI